MDYSRETCKSQSINPIYLDLVHLGYHSDHIKSMPSMFKSPAGKGLTSWLSFVNSNFEVTFPLVSGSGVVLNCIDS